VGASLLRQRSGSTDWHARAAACAREPGFAHRFDAFPERHAICTGDSLRDGVFTSPRAPHLETRPASLDAEIGVHTTGTLASSMMMSSWAL